METPALLDLEEAFYCDVRLVVCCCCSVIKLCPTLCDPMDCSTPGFPVLPCPPPPGVCWTQVHQVGDSIQPSLPLLPLLLLPSIFLSIRVFSNELALHIRWQKYWVSSISPPVSTEGWFPLELTASVSLQYLVVQGTFKSLLQHFSLKVSILQCSALFMVQLPHLYMTTGKP